MVYIIVHYTKPTVIEDTESKIVINFKIRLLILERWKGGYFHYFLKMFKFNFNLCFYAVKSNV